MRPFLAVLVLMSLGSAGSAEIRFQERSSEWHLEFSHHHGGSGEFYMPETMGAGVAILDYDRDGDNDVLFVDSGPLPAKEDSPSGSRLFRNDGAIFTDVTKRSGLAPRSYGMGVTVADYDNDAYPDVYLTAFGRNSLWRNRGDGTFEEVTDDAGVADSRWSASAAFGDGDGDGWLDLYVSNYVDFSLESNVICGDERKRLRSYCHPDVYGGIDDAYYRNLGNGGFAEVSAGLGLEKEAGRGLGVLFDDLTGDGRPDIYVANDSSLNFLFQNLGAGRFEEVALLVGVALSEAGKPEAGMGVSHGDLDGDGLPEIMVTHLDLETNAVYSAVPGGIFVDRRFTSRLGEPSLYRVGFGLVFADLDLDGDLDVAVANGHIIHNVDLEDRNLSFEQPNQVFANNGSGVFDLVQNAGVDVVLSSRGLAAGDLDNDGDLDLLISNSNARAEVYENVSRSTGHYLAVRARGPGGGVVGTRLELIATDRRQVRTLVTGSSYLSQHQSTALFGFSEPADLQLNVRWPGGNRFSYLSQPADSTLVLPAP